MKRIYRAINEGINKSLINFDNDSGFEKTKVVNRNIKFFTIGDYVYYDEDLGYNNYTGKKVAICISDKPGKEIYMVLEHLLYTKYLRYANEGSQLYNDILPDFENSWETTLYILNNYGKNELARTIWKWLGENEYIPSKDELLTIYNTCKDTPLWDEIGFVQDFYWTSSQYELSNQSTFAYEADFSDGEILHSDKNNEGLSVVLLHIN